MKTAAVVFSFLWIASTQACLEIVPVRDKRGILRDGNGRQYDMQRLKPYTGVFSPDRYRTNGNKVTEKRTGKSLRNPMYRGYFGKTLVLVLTEASGRAIYAETRRGDQVETMCRFTGAENVTETRSLYFDEAPVLPVRGGKRSGKRDGGRRLYRSLQSTTGVCEEYTTVKIGIGYDTEFCESYGRRVIAVERIIAIISSASLHYEFDLCVKLQLTDIFTPDRRCKGTSAHFNAYSRDVSCTTRPNLLSQFSSWIARERNNLKLDPDAQLHLFTGYKQGASLGCAWKGTLCWTRYAYGVEYITKRSDIFLQGVMFAHELGHNLNAPHYNSNQGDFVMESRLSPGVNGFSERSRQVVDAFLSSRRARQCTGTLSLETQEREILPPLNAGCAQVGGNGSYACLPLTDVADALNEHGFDVGSALGVSGCDDEVPVVNAFSIGDGLSNDEFSGCGSLCAAFTDVICVATAAEGEIILEIVAHDSGGNLLFQDVGVMVQNDTTGNGSCAVASPRCV